VWVQIPPLPPFEYFFVGGG